MEIISPVANALFVLIMTIVLTWYMRDRFGDVDRRFSEMRGELKEVRSELKQDIADVRAEIRDVRGDLNRVRSDLTQVALAVGATLREDSA